MENRKEIRMNHSNEVSQVNKVMRSVDKNNISQKYLPEDSICTDDSRKPSMTFVEFIMYRFTKVM